MLFSDELLEIGRAANPKNPASIYRQAMKLNDLFNSKLDILKGTTNWVEFKRLETTFDFIMKTLKKEGFDYTQILVKSNKSK